MKKSLSVLALLLSLLVVLSFGTLSVGASSDDTGATEDSVVSTDSTVDTTADSSDDETSDATSDETSDETSDATSDETSDESSGDEDDVGDDDGNEFPWALVIFLAIVIALAIAAFICIKANNKVGIWLKNFFRDYKSEIGKVTWPSKNVTIKSTIVVIVCLVVSGAVIGLLDFGLIQLIEWLAELIRG